MITNRLSAKHVVVPTSLACAAMIGFAACALPAGPSADDRDPVSAIESIIINPDVLQCVSVKRGSAYGDVEDAQLVPGYPSGNFGAAERITVTGLLGSNFPGSNIKSLVKFKINANAIPAGAVVRSAQAYFRAIEPNGNSSLAVYNVTSPWQESAVTKNNFPANGFATPAIRTPFTSDLDTLKVDLTQQVIDWMSGAVPNNGLLIGLGPDALASEFVFSVGSSESELPPYVNICYTVSPCAGKADGTACDDASRCIDNGACLAGVCQGGQPAPTGTVCRAAASLCDVAEVCNGTTKQCPTAAIAAKGVECRAAAGPCDSPEKCDGASFSCPSDDLKAAGTVCRAASGACDVAETCTGAGAQCPTDGFKSSATVCRAANGACDAAENCTGTSPSCPADGFKSSATVCRAANGACDVAENCTGTSPSCPADGFKASGISCRAANGVCDVPESCTGNSASCPADGFAAAGISCRAANGVCDVADACTGGSASCPDNHVPDGQSCGASNVCSGGSCVTCGQTDGPCCSGAQCTGDNICASDNNGNSKCVHCGLIGQVCCPGNVCHDSGPFGMTKCLGGGLPLCVACGGDGQDCCDNSVCNDGLWCQSSGKCQ